MSRSYLSLRVGIFATFFFLFLNVFSQSATPGLIIKSAKSPGNSVLDPDGDGYVSQKSNGVQVGFTNPPNNDVSQSELPYVAIVRPDPIGDILRGPKGGFTDIVGVDIAENDAIQTYTDGVNLLVRFRLGGYAPNSKSYSLLIDTDQKFGFSGTNADPNAIDGNLGFEAEIVLQTNFNVKAFNIDGTENAVEVASFDYDTHCQKSIAITTAGDNPDYFYDFYLPLASVSSLFDENTLLRIVAITVMNPHEATGNNALSDVGGITVGSNINDIFTELIEGQTPTPPGEEVLHRSACPSINAPIKTDFTSISGSSTEADGTSITLDAYEADNSFIGSVSTTVLNGFWSVDISDFSGLNFSVDQYFKATATADNKGESYDDCSKRSVLDAGAPACSSPVPESLLLSPNNKTNTVTYSVSSEEPGYRLQLYNISDNTVRATDPAYYITDGSLTYEFNGVRNSDKIDDTYLLITDENGNCSPYIMNICSGGTYLDIPIISEPIAAGNNTTISGVCQTGSVIEVFVNNVSIGTADVIGTSWSIVTSLDADATVYVAASHASYCSINSTTTTVGCEPSSTPSISSEIVAGDTQITGTSGIDAVVEVFKNTISLGVTTAVGNTWQMTGVTLSENDEIYVIATESGKCEAYSTSLVVLPTPTCNIDVNFCGATDIVSGTIATTGGSVQVWKVGTPDVQHGSSVAISNSGIWTASVPTLSSGNSFYAVASLANGAEATSSIETISSQTSSTATISSVPIIEQMTELSGTGISGETITLYVDGVVSDYSVIVGGDGAWTLSDIASYDLYIGAEVAVTSKASGECESDFSESNIVQCNMPSEAVYAGGDYTYCLGSSGLLPLTTSTPGVVYQFVDALGVAQGPAAVGNGSAISISTYALWSDLNDVFVRAYKIGSSSCSSVSSTAVNFTPAGPIPTIDFTTTSLSVEKGNTTINLPYTAKSTSPSADVYDIDYSVDANAQGFSDIGTPISISSASGNLVLNVPASAEEGTYHGTLRIAETSGSSCYSYYDIAITVYSSTGAPVISEQPISASICENTSIAISVAASNATSYQWQFSDYFSGPYSDIVGAVLPDYTSDDLTDTIYYRASVGNANDNIYSDIASVNVNPYPLRPTIAAGGFLSFFAGDSVVLTSSDAFTYQWYKDAVAIPFETNKTYTAKTSGNYTVIVENSSSCTSTVSNIISVSVTVSNAHPIAAADNRVIDEDNSVKVAVLENDNDVDGSITNLDTIGVVAALHGDVIIIGDTIVYTPNENYYGSDSLQYVITDNEGATDTAWVIILINSINDIPSAGNEYVHSYEDVEFDTENVLLNNVDVEGHVVLSDSAALQGGAFTYSPLDSTFHYVPVLNYFGHDTIVYTICDEENACINDSVFISIESINDLPVATNDSRIIFEDEFIVIPVVDNDVDTDGIIINVSTSGVSQAVHGAVSLKDDSLQYIPNTDFFGLDSFQYVITDDADDKDTAWVFMTVTPVNDPLSQGNEFVHTDEDTPFYTINVLLNNTDIEGGLVLSDSATMQGSTISYNPLDSTFYYVSASNYSGHDTIVYTVCDGDGACVNDSVFITIEEINDFPIAMNDSGLMQEDEDIAIAVVVNDTDIDGMIINLATVGVSQANHGTINLNGYLIEYSPDFDFFGVDSLQYIITDDGGNKDTAWVFLSVIPVNDPPLQGNELVHTLEDLAFTTENVLLNNTDVDGVITLNDSLTLQGGEIIYNPLDSTFHYMPLPNYSGHDTIIYQVCDDEGACVFDSVFVTIGVVNDSPIAVNDDVNTLEDEVIFVAVVDDNDSDSDGTIVNLSVFGVSQATRGTVQIHGDSIEYIPDADFFGSDSLQYVITDDGGDKDTAWVFITIASVNDMPSQGNEYVHAFEDMPFDTENVLLNNTDVDGTVEVSDSVALQGGTISYNPLDSTFHYVPLPNYFGHDTIVYQVCDDEGECVLDSVFITIDEINDFPIAVDDVVNTLEDEIIFVPVVDDNDTDSDGLIIDLSLFGVSQALHGTVYLHGDSLEYIPNPDFFGSDSLQYVITDDIGDKDTAWVYITIASVNDNPNQGNELLILDEDVSVSTPNVLSNNLDIDGNVSVIDSSVKHGVVSYNSDDSTFTYTPNSNYFGKDTIFYTVCDDSTACVYDSVFVSILSVNDSPEQGNESVTVDEDMSVTTPNVLVNNFDVDGSVSVIASSANYGTVTYQSSGSTFVYSPDDNYYGLDTIIYTVCDDALGCVFDSVFVTINSLNDSPSQGNEYEHTDKNVAYNTENVLLNNVDIDGFVTLSDSSTRQGGVIDYNSLDSTFYYTPADNYVGHDTIVYTVCDDSLACVNDSVFITIGGGENQPPAAVNDIVSTQEDVFIAISIADNDSDIDGTIVDFCISGVVQAQHGAAQLQGDSLIYTADANYFGSDSLQYVITDDNGDKDTAWVFVTIASVNDMPSQGNELLIMDEDTSVFTSNVLANNLDVDGTVSVADSSANHGLVTYNPIDSTFTYSPELNYFGDDTIFYSVCDDSTCVFDSVFVSILPLNDAPLQGNESLALGEDGYEKTPNILDNNMDVDGTVSIIASSANHGTLVYNPGDSTFTYSPQPHYFGNDTIFYTVCDSDLACTFDSVFVSIASVNDVPSQGNEYVHAFEDLPFFTDNVLLNNIDVDGIVSVSDSIRAQLGTIVYNPEDSTFHYTPASNYAGYDTIFYTVCDDSSACVADSIFIVIAEVNDFPVAVNDSFDITEDESVGIPVIINDTDIDGMIVDVSLSGIVQASHGIVSLEGNNIAYDPDENYFGNDSLQYVITDDFGDKDTAWVFFYIASVNDSPNQGNEYVNAFEDLPFFTDNILLNNTDVDGVITLSDSSTSQGGVIDYNSLDSTFYYTPAPNYTGYDTIVYTVCDDSLACVVDSVFITITEVNDIPVAVNDSFDINEDASVVVSVVNNDTDLDGTIVDLSLLGVSQANYATVSLSGDSIIYSPDENYFGNDSLQYVITDDFGDKDTAWVFFYIASVNDAPDQGNEYVHGYEDLPFFTDNVLSNNSDVDGLITVSSYATKQGGTAEFDLNDSVFYYTPASNYAGYDTIIYIVCDDSSACVSDSVFITISDVNDAPVAINDYPFAINEDESIVVPITLNDIDSDGVIVNVLTLGVIQSSHGEVYSTADSLRYTPDANYFGEDSLQYVIVDDFGGRDTAWVYISILPVNDAPSQGNEYLHAYEDVALNTENVLSNNTDIDGVVELTDAETTQDGLIVYDSIDSTFYYTPAENYVGMDTIFYTVCDDSDACVYDSVFVNVEAVNDYPLALNDSARVLEDDSIVISVVQNNDTDIDGVIVDVSIFAVSLAIHGQVEVNGIELTYIPDANFYGNDSLQYVVTDDSGDKDTAWVFVSVASVNDGPTSGDEFETVREDSTLVTQNVLDNNLDQDGEVSISSFSANHGVVVYNSIDSTFSYIPGTNYFGFDTIIYTVCDDSLVCVSDSVFVTIISVNDAPHSGNETLKIYEDATANTPNILLNNTDVDGFVELNHPMTTQLGTVVYDPSDSTFLYTPPLNYYGIDTVIYQVCDNGGACVDDSIFVEITAVNDAPLSGNEETSTGEDMATVTPNILRNNVDVDGMVSVGPFVTTQGGTTVYNIKDSTFTYVPVADFNGVDTILYTVCDDVGICVSDSLFIAVISIGDVPVAYDDFLIVDEMMGSSVTMYGIADNDSDVDGNLDTTSIRLVNDEAGTEHESLYVEGEGLWELDTLLGNVTFTPDENFFGDPTPVPYVIYDHDGFRSSMAFLEIIFTRYELIYNGNGTAIDVPYEDNGYMEGDSVFIQDLVPQWDGYSFDGWEVNIDGEVSVYMPGDTMIMPGIDVELLALWIEVSLEYAFVPEAFTPNNDGDHDFFVLPWLNDIAYDVALKVFNRWGDEVFVDDDYDNSWNGESNTRLSIGRTLPDGTYFYVIEIASPEKETRQGYVYIKK